MLYLYCFLPGGVVKNSIYKTPGQRLVLSRSKTPFYIFMTKYPWKWRFLLEFIVFCSFIEVLVAILVMLIAWLIDDLSIFGLWWDIVVKLSVVFLNLSAGILIILGIVWMCLDLSGGF